MGMTPLWPHQEEGLARLYAAEAAGAQGVVVQAPTGSGKTRMAIEVLRRHADEGGTGLLLAHREELLDQPVQRLWAEGLRSIRVIRAGRVEGDPYARIIVASIQTLVARDHAPDASRVIFDESRHYVASEWGKIANRYGHALRLGFDATPGRPDNTSQRGLFDTLLSVSSVAELIGKGILVPPIVYAPDEFQDELAEHPVVAYERRAAGRQAIVFGASVAHAQALAAEFTAAGYRAECVEGRMTRERRRNALAAFERGEVRILTNVAVLTEGTDLPPASCIIVARGVSSPSMWIQIGGRGLRRHEGKKDCVLLDLKGHVHCYGLLEEHRTWTLDGEPVRDVEALQAISQCRKCHAWGTPRGRCAACGSTLPPPKPPKVSKKELKEIRQSTAPRVGADWEMWLELVRTQRERGYKPQWAAMRFRASTGRFPRWGVSTAIEEIKSCT